MPRVRMLMYGFVEEGSVDISAGSVYGLWYEVEEDGSKIWHKGLAPTVWDFEARCISDFLTNYVEGVIKELEKYPEEKLAD